MLRVFTNYAASQNTKQFKWNNCDLWNYTNICVCDHYINIRRWEIFEMFWAEFRGSLLADHFPWRLFIGWSLPMEAFDCLITFYRGILIGCCIFLPSVRSSFINRLAAVLVLVLFIKIDYANIMCFCEEIDYLAVSSDKTTIPNQKQCSY